MKHLTQNWYVRREGKVIGPFPAGLVSRYILLGRIRHDDQISEDSKTWFTVRDRPDLIPDVMREARTRSGDGETLARLESARRWADERRAPHGHPLQGEERREHESLDEIGLREAREGREPGMARRSFKDYLVIVVILAAVVGLPFLAPEQENAVTPHCGTMPQPEVNWSSCLMSGRDLANVDLSRSNLRSADLSGARLSASSLREADLSYVNLTHAILRGANLTGAIMKGANLRRADLSNANLSGADLSYAIFTGANLAGIDLTGARMDHAEWKEGVLCMPGSVGRCVTGSAEAGGR